MKHLAPIVLFCYNRPGHTRQTLEALRENELAAESVLYVFCDGPKEDAGSAGLEHVQQVREVIRSEKWCGEVHVTEQPVNMGLAKSIVSGVTDIVNKHGKVIVLEDDIVTARGFLKYMNDALDLYREDNDVMEVSGFMFPIESSNLPDTFFYAANSCWGWGTWKRAWDLYDNDTERIYRNLMNRNVDWPAFNAFQKNAFRAQLEDNLSGKINTWSVKWHAVMYLNGGTVLHPRKSLTRNIGFDGSGTYCGDEEPGALTTDLAASIAVKRHGDLNSPEALRRLKDYFNPPAGWMAKMKHKAKQVYEKIYK